MSLRDELEAAGLNIKAVTGWGSRGSTWFYGKPIGVMHHHTVLPVPYPVDRLYVKQLKCNINTKPDGTVWLVAQGAPNYSSGKGSSVVLKEILRGDPPTANARERGLADDMGGNPYFFGFENDHPGDGSPIPEVQLDAICIATKVVCDHYGLGAGNVTSHAEWTTRKRDPYWNGSLRAIEDIRKATDMLTQLADYSNDLIDFIDRLKAMDSSVAFVDYLIPDMRKNLVTMDELQKALDGIEAGTVDQVARQLARDANEKLARIKAAI